MSQITQQIQGSPRARILREFVTNSAVFPLLDAIRAISTEGIILYVGEAPHYLLFFAAALQAWFLGKHPTLSRSHRALGNLIAPTLYTLGDLALEGATVFAAEPNHWIYWGFSLGIAFLTVAAPIIPNGKQITTLLINVWRVLLFPALYANAELGQELHLISPWTAWREYWFMNSGHLFILLAALMFGLLLGLRDVQIDRYITVLRRLAHQLKRVSEWSLDPGLLADSLQDRSALAQRRMHRAVLFMDIRDFTHWSEDKTPEQVVRMLNHFYEQGEGIILDNGGQKPHFIGDEVMTWFDNAGRALHTARQLQAQMPQTLGAYNLAVGIGAHWGMVVEGMMGSSGTQSYNIIGDTVNTASRLVAAAEAGEVIVSATLAQAADAEMTWHEERRDIRVKGKQEPIQAFVFKDRGLDYNRSPVARRHTPDSDA